MPVQRLTHEPLGRKKIALFAQHEFDRITNAVDGPAEIHPLTAHLYVGLVQVPPWRAYGAAREEFTSAPFA